MVTPLIEDLFDIYARTQPAHQRARNWRFDAAFVHIPVDFLGTLVVSTALAVLLAPHADMRALGAWLVLALGLASVRLIVSIRWARSDPAGRSALRHAFSTSLMLHGLLTAAPLLVLTAPEAVAERSAILVWMIATSAWVVTAYAWVLEAALGYLLLQLTPAVVLLLMSGERHWQFIGIACCAYLAAMAVVLLRNHSELMHGYINLCEKEELTEALRREKAAADASNAALAADLERHTLIETDLREAKRRAETLAAELETLSALDGLTGIANRRRFDQMLDREWNRGARGSRPLALILCDIDYFKQYNDLYGHQAGDACLRQLATLLQSALRRAGDLAARYGGEEFAVLLPDTPLASATQLADAIREQLRALGIPHDASPLMPVLTASFGVAALIPPRTGQPASLIKAADEALYAAKAAGRNRVMAAGAAGTPLHASDVHLH